MSLKTSINGPVFYPSVVCLIALVLIGVIWPDSAQLLFDGVQHWLQLKAGWLYILGVAGFLIFIVFIMVSRYGDIKLGPDHSEPDYSYGTWIAMLFSAGMGIGLMFFGIGEPVMHFLAPPDADPQSLKAAKDALKITFFHWGLHAWAIYAVVALSLAYFSYRHKLPLLPRSALYPLIGERIYGPIGHTVDTLAVIGTVLGVATSLGFGVAQVNSGLHYLIGDSLPIAPVVQVILITLITGLATISVVTGVDKGIKVLSELNMGLAFVLMIFVLLVGPTVTLLQHFVQNTGAYLSDIVNKTFNLYAYQQKNDWLGGWTLFYWGWWISWSPFVGTFIARVSRGRTIRQFLVGVMFVPTGFTFLWMTIFGNSAIDAIVNQGAQYLADAVSSDVSVALFTFFEHLPFSGLLSILGVCLVVTFFVTSSDSGSLVVDNLTSGGDENAPVWQRVFWALAEGVVASALLLAGGLKALQTASIASAMPFLIVMILMCVGLFKALKDDRLKLMSVRLHNSTVQYAKTSVAWQEHLDVLISHPTYNEARAYLDKIAESALTVVEKEFNRRGISAELQYDNDNDRIRLILDGTEQQTFVYALRVRSYTLPGLSDDNDKNYYRVEVFLEHGGQYYDVMGYTEEQLQADVVTQYEKYRHYLHLSIAEYVNQ
ncbi:BCCT family transporter [Shewanella avicenniae]|uniref:BCCT family transporter n=1 Tax=Shewanella avicenniae TaxID=2814294 RepID=A0ABX7QUK6_9GAMM|nr:BCCT family transporter [Shewanella avicenniae]QSX34954.1 BCCT family transporter [Shewanella avicenniae]